MLIFLSSKGSFSFVVMNEYKGDVKIDTIINFPFSKSTYGLLQFAKENFDYSITEFSNDLSSVDLKFKFVGTETWNSSKTKLSKYCEPICSLCFNPYGKSSYVEISFRFFELTKTATKIILNFRFMTYGENSGYGGSGPFPMNSKRIWENNFIQNYISFMANFIVPNSSELKILSSGTCFAVNENGFLITNYHVVENAKKISVRGINNEFNNTIIANVIAIDKNNDLALLKLTDTIYQGFFSSIPYILSQNKCDVGESVYSLGFPLRSTMGDEVKLNNGIISSNSGFNGDVTCYQTSVPVQPGNSGGPLFNISGEIIGIINAKHKGAENVSYAVKKDYMRIFLDNSNVNFKRVASTNLKKMDLVNQFKEVKKFVFIVEVEN